VEESTLILKALADSLKTYRPARDQYVIRIDRSGWTLDNVVTVAALHSAWIVAGSRCRPAFVDRYPYQERGESFAEGGGTHVGEIQRQNRSEPLPRRAHPAELAARAVGGIIKVAPGSDAMIGGVEITVSNAWFVPRPSVTDALGKIYAQRFLGTRYLRRLIDGAQSVPTGAMRKVTPPVRQVTKVMPSSHP